MEKIAWVCWLVEVHFLVGILFMLLDCDKPKRCGRKIHWKFSYYGTLIFYQKYRAKICPKCFGEEDE